MLKYNLSTYFIFPSLQLKINMNVLACDEYLINTYLKNNQLPLGAADCFMVLKFTDYNYIELEINKLIEKSKLFLFSYPRSSKEVVYAFKYNDLFKNDIDLIIEGAYNKVSKEYQNLFTLTEHCEVFGERDSFYNQVFSNDVALKKYWEDLIQVKLDDSVPYFEKINLEKETL